MGRHVIIWPGQTSPALPVAIMISDDDSCGSHLHGELLVAEFGNGSLPPLKLRAKQASPGENHAIHPDFLTPVDISSGKHQVPGARFS